MNPLINAGRRISSPFTTAAQSAKEGVSKTWGRLVANHQTYNPTKVEKRTSTTYDEAIKASPPPRSSIELAAKPLPKIPSPKPLPSITQNQADITSLKKQLKAANDKKQELNESLENKFGIGDKNPIVIRQQLMKLEREIKQMNEKLGPMQAKVDAEKSERAVHKVSSTPIQDMSKESMAKALDELHIAHGEMADLINEIDFQLEDIDVIESQAEFKELQDQISTLPLDEVINRFVSLAKNEKIPAGEILALLTEVKKQERAEKMQEKLNLIEKHLQNTLNLESYTLSHQRASNDYDKSHDPNALRFVNDIKFKMEKLQKDLTYSKKLLNEVHQEPIAEIPVESPISTKNVEIQEGFKKFQDEISTIQQEKTRRFSIVRKDSQPQPLNEVLNKFVSFVKTEAIPPKELLNLLSRVKEQGWAAKELKNEGIQAQVDLIEKHLQNLLKLEHLTQTHKQALEDYLILGSGLQFIVNLENDMWETQKDIGYSKKSLENL